MVGGTEKREISKKDSFTPDGLPDIGRLIQKAGHRPGFFSNFVYEQNTFEQDALDRRC
jgi:hypothetical protein